MVQVACPKPLQQEGRIDSRESRNDIHPFGL